MRVCVYVLFAYTRNYGVLINFSWREGEGEAFLPVALVRDIIIRVLFCG